MPNANRTRKFAINQMVALTSVGSKLTGYPIGTPAKIITVLSSGLHAGGYRIVIGTNTKSVIVSATDITPIE